MNRRTESGALPPPGWLLWASFLLTPVLWFVWFMAAYVFNEATCGAVANVSSGLGVAVGSVLFLATALVVLASAGATWLSVRVRRRAVRSAPVYDDFLPHVGTVMGWLVTFVIAAHLIPLVLVGTCG